MAVLLGLKGERGRQARRKGRAVLCGRLEEQPGRQHCYLQRPRPSAPPCPPHRPWRAVLRRDGGAGTARGGCAGAGSGGAVSAGRLELEPGLRGWVRGCWAERRRGEDAGKRELCSRVRGPDPGAQALCPEACTRGTGPASDPEPGVALSAGGTSEVRLAFVALMRVAQVIGAPLNEDSPLPQGCGGKASHDCTPPWKLTSEVASAFVEWRAASHPWSRSVLVPERAGSPYPAPETPFCVFVAGSFRLPWCKTAVRPRALLPRARVGDHTVSPQRWSKRLTATVP